MKYKYPVLLLGCCICFLFLCNPSNLYFLSDDFDTLLKIQREGYILHSFRPFTDLTLKANYLLWNYNAPAYFFTNAALHLLSTFLLYLFTKQLYSSVATLSETKQYAFFTAVFFLFYPYHSEPLFWMVGRGGPLSTLMVLLSLYFYLKREKSACYYIFSLVFFIAGAFSYEAAWVLPMIIAIISFVNIKNKLWRRELFYVFGFGIVFISILIARYFLVNQMISSPYGALSILPSDFPRLIRNFAALVSRSFIPPVANSLVFLFCSLSLAGLLLFVFYKMSKQRNTVVIISILSFFISMLPAIPFGINTHNTESERFLYLPSVFLAISVIAILKSLLKKQFLYIFATILIAEISFLFYNYQSFKTSSIVTRQTVQAFSFLKNVDGLYCNDLPSQYRGAYIFRNGFESALKLFTEVKNIKILSKMKLESKPTSYHITTFTLGDAIKKELLDSKSPRENVVVFDWKENGLEIYK